MQNSGNINRSISVAGVQFSPKFSDDGNSESGMATLPIGDRKNKGGGNIMKNCSEYQSSKKAASGPNYSTVNNGGEAVSAEITTIKPSGRHTFSFWIFYIVIVILSIGNLMLTVTIVGVLRMGKGMEFMELVPEADTIKFFGISDLDRVYKKDGLIEGFSDVPITITGDNSNAQISLVKHNGHVHNKMLMSKNGTSFNGINQFELKDSQTAETIFTTHKPRYNLPSGVDNLKAKVISASRIEAPIDEMLTLNNTRGKILFRGTEGIKLEAKEIVLTADQDLHLKSHNGSVVITGSNGIFIDIKNIPIVGETKTEKTLQYKICVCMPQGKLFRVPLSQTSHLAKGVCSHFSAKHDPCM